MPTGGQITAGAGAISHTDANTTVNQASQNLSLNWQSFNVGSHESVNFVQPNAAAIAVNRIADTSASQILGSLNANGQVFLINPNGIVFGAGAQVNVGGLVASTLNINDSDLASATRHFSGSGSGAVVNHGTITAAPGGYVALLGRHVSNQGTISAPGGTVALGAGSTISLSFDANNLLSMQVDQSTLTTLAENKQLIVADGGQVLMSAGAKNSLLASVVNNTGVVQAQTVAHRKGQIVLLAGMAAGRTTVDGTLDASAPEGDGGFIETSGAYVQVADSARITTRADYGQTGNWLIDPPDYIIAASGGNISGSALSTRLVDNNIEIMSSQGTMAGNGNINVNDAVSWSTNTLTLTAANNININAVMTAGGSAGLVLNTAMANGGDAGVAGGAVNAMPGVGRVDFAGRSGTGFLTINGNDYTVLNSVGVQGDETGGATTLQGMAATANLTGYYALGSNIDASATSSWDSGGGFVPIGDGAASFTGSFDGLGNTISGLTINSGLEQVGLFGAADSTAQIRNVGLIGVDIAGNRYVGGLVGHSKSSISNSYATGAVRGDNFVGGLVGQIVGGSISNSYATGAVSGSDFTGGLVGQTFGGSGSISNSYATGAVSGGYYAGGLVGDNGGSITNSYATGNVSDNGLGGDVGGLVGENWGSITNSYATGAVSSNRYAGGLVGDNSSGGSISTSYATGAVSSSRSAGGLAGNNSGSISNSYATGNVSGAPGADEVGGLVGRLSSGGISNSYATGNVSGTAWVMGGLVGFIAGGAATVSNSYWNKETTGQNHSESSSDAFGLTSEQMKHAANFDGWDISATGGSASVWRIYEGYTTPLLRAFMTDLLIPSNMVSTYTGTAFASANAYTFGTPTPSFWLPSNSIDTSLILGSIGTTTPAVNVGTYTLNGAPYSSQMGYDIAFTPGQLTINPAPLQYVANNATRPYGATDPVFTGTVTGLVGGDILASVTTGTLSWTTSATATSPAGLYSIFGSGLSVISANYSGLNQAPGNSTALTVQAEVLPTPSNPTSVPAQTEIVPTGALPTPRVSNETSTTIASVTQSVMQVASGQTDDVEPKLYTVIGSGVRLP